VSNSPVVRLQVQVYNPNLMILTELNLRDPSKPKATKFGGQNSVGEFLEDRKFRQHCVNLRCFPVRLQHQRLYKLMCDEVRFHRQGIAQAFEMPSVKVGRLSPVTYMVIPTWTPFISCPLICNGYKNRTVAKLERVGKEAAGWVFHHVLKPAEIFWAAIWAYLFK
jgi:hypothetical protein